MQVKELPDGTNISRVKMRLPEELEAQAVSAGLKTTEVYLGSAWNQGVWLKEDPDSDRIYPLTGVFTDDLLEWEIIE
jgi:hypothetical protein